MFIRFAILDLYCIQLPVKSIAVYLFQFHKEHRVNLYFKTRYRLFAQTTDEYQLHRYV